LQNFERAFKDWRRELALFTNPHKLFIIVCCSAQELRDVLALQEGSEFEEVE